MSVKEYIETASYADFEKIFETIPITPLQRDIINLRMIGYDPSVYTEQEFPVMDNPPMGYPNIIYLSGFRKGKRLTREELSSALQIHTNTITIEMRKIYNKIERSGLAWEWLERGGK